MECPQPAANISTIGPGAVSTSLLGTQSRRHHPEPTTVSDESRLRKAVGIERVVEQKRGSSLGGTRRGFGRLHCVERIPQLTSQRDELSVFAACFISLACDG
jgi:hypothetical protein